MKETNKGLVSVIITTFHGGERLSNCINSVLEQTYKNIEIIIVDDNDPNTGYRSFTEQIMKQYEKYEQIFYLKHKKNMNGAVARNTGIAACHGEYVSFLDDDDIYYSNKIELCVKALENNRSYSSVYSSVDIFYRNHFIESRPATISGNVWKELLIDEGMLGTGSNLFFRKECLNELGGFDIRFIRYQDVEFMLRLLQKYKILAISPTLIRKNVEQKNIPKYEEYRQNRILIFNVFSNLINQLDNDAKNYFYKNKFYYLLESAISSCNRKNIRLAIKEYKMYGSIDFNTRLKCLFPKLYKMHLKALEKKQQ